MSPLDKNLAIGVTIAAVVILAASFLPWGDLHAKVEMPLMPFLPPGQPSPLGGLEVTQSITGWNSYLELLRIKLPNALVVFAAIGLATLCWLKARSLWTSPPALTFGLAVYGLVHSIAFLGVLLGSARSSVGVGLLLSIAGFVGMLVALVRHQRAGKHAKSPEMLA